MKIDLPVISKAVAEYSPYLYLHSKERSFPISAVDYIKETRVLEAGQTLAENPTFSDLHNFKKQGKSGLVLQFKNPDSQDRLAGSPDNAVVYSKVVHNGTFVELPGVKTTDVYTLIYFFLFSHTEPYNCCLIGFPLTKWAHRADLKFMAVRVHITDEEIIPKKVFFGAHGTKAGVWKEYSEVEKYGTHPIGYVAKGDHSIYFDSGPHPRIYFVAWDLCQKAILSIPRVEKVYEETDEGLFLPELHGWVYFPGNMNEDGIVAPWLQNFWEAKIPDESNTALKRLFVPEFF